MLLPYVFWLIAWAVFWPGPKQGFDVPLSLAMLAVTVPLVVWFFLSNLGFMANTIAGEDPYDRPSGAWVPWILARLPAASLLIGVASAPYLLLQNEPVLLIPLPFVMALLVAWAIRRGESARQHERRGVPDKERVPPERTIGPAIADLGAAALKLVYLVPVFGWLLREAVQGSDEDRTFFAINLALSGVLVAVLFGFQALFFIALASVPLVFLSILLLTTGD